jgi:hypothetical protein
MKKLLSIFLIASILKGILLYLLILFLPTALTYLVFFLTLCIIDWKIMAIVSRKLKDVRWYKLLVFTFFTFIPVLWITATLFRLHNSIFNIVTKGDANMPIGALFIFVLCGLIFSIFTIIIWQKRRKKNYRQQQV